MSDVSQSVTYAEAAVIAGKSRQTIARWVLAGKIPAFSVPGDVRHYIRREDLDAFLRPTPVVTHTETVEEWAQRVAADAPPMTSEQAQYVMSALRTASPAVAAVQGGAAA